MRLAEKDLARRGTRIMKLLRPISLRQSGPAFSKVPGPTYIIFGAHDEARPTSDYRDWRFSITVPGFVAMYFELWRFESRDRYLLEKAYLNIYKRVDAGEEEVICLHCDPSLSEEADHVKYKRGPHIHMSVAGYPYSRAHIALRGPDVSEKLESAESIHNALTWGIEMIRDEVITLM